MAEQVLFDAHFQRSFLAFILRDSEFLKQVERDVTHEMFSDEYGKRIVIACKEFYAENKAAPDTLIFRVFGKYLQEGMMKKDLHDLCVALADDLFAIPLQNRSFLLKEFGKFLKHRMFETTLPKVVDFVRKGDFDSAESSMKEVFLFKPTHTTGMGKEFSEHVEERVLRREDEDRQRLWLLIPHIDKRVRGLRKGEIGVWQSQRSSSGKSCALAHCAKAFAMQGKNVVIFTLEMGEEAYEDRLDMAISGLTRSEMRDAAILRNKLKSVVRRSGKIVIKALPAYVTRCSDLRAHCQLMEAMNGFRPDVVLIDYADLLGPETPALRSDLYATGAEVYSYWRCWMHEEQLVGWTGMQSGRDAMSVDHADQMHASGSIAKIQIADMVISINRTAEEEAEGLTRIHVVKAREDRARITEVFPTDFERMQFWDAKRDTAWKDSVAV